MSRLSRALRAVALVALAGGPLCMAPAFAQSAPASPTAPTTTTQVSGTVTDTTGAPVAGASIILRGAQTYTATSDAQGRYALLVAPGVYTASVTRAGFQSGSERDVAVIGGTPVDLNVQLVAPTLSSLRVIGSTRTSFSRATFNASPAAVTVVSTQTFVDQGQPQVKNVLNQTPGLVISLPATSGNGAAAGAITFPNIRGGLSFETASLIDGHNVSVGAFGDYVSTFLNSFLLQSVEVVKGPGAAAPEVNYAIGGTVNFRTLDPTRTPTGYETVGIDSFGGTFSNVGYSNTVAKGKLGFVLDYAIDGTQGPLNDFRLPATLGSSYQINGQPLAAPTNSRAAIPGTSQFNNNATTTLLYSGLPISTTYSNKAELAKLRYNFSGATSLTASYLGSQTWTEQNGNHFYQSPSNFAPAASYASITGPQPGPMLIERNVFPPQHEYEINNEPIFQGELRTTLATNTILARAYSASISRLQYNGLTNPAQPAIIPTQLYGTASVCPIALVKGACPVAPVAQTFNGQNVVLTVPGAYFNDSEEDRLHGYSLEVDHPFGDTGNLLSFAIDSTKSTTGKYDISQYVPGSTADSAQASVPPTSGQTFTTILARYIGNVGPRTSFTLSNYFNNYLTHYSNNNGGRFLDQHNSHYDARLGLTYRANPDASLRFSLGSAIAPPYIGLYSRVSSAPLIDRSNTFATNTQANASIKPETSFGYNLGADVRLGPDKQTLFSGDVYLTNLNQQLIGTSQFANGFVSVPSYQAGDKAGSPTGPLVSVPLTSTGSTNLAQARYEGIELSLRRDPAVGFGFTVQGSLQKAYPLNVPASFYTNPGSTVPVRNLGVVPGANFYANSSVSNQPIPYSQGYGEIRYRTPGGGLLSFGETYYGPNNSLFLPAFLIANANARVPLGHGYSLNLNVDNAFNTNGNAYITEFGGLFQPYVNGAATVGGGGTVVPLSGAQLNANTYGPRNVKISLSKRIGG